MSRSQFVRNTLAAIQMQLQPNPAQSSSSDITLDDRSVRGSDGTETIATSPARSKRSGSIASWSSIPREALGLSSPGSSTASPAPHNGSSVSMQITSPGGASVVYSRSWENDMENLLKVGDDRALKDLLNIDVETGNVQCHQEPANITAAWQRPDAVLYVISQSRVNCVEKSKSTGTA
jgi:hypothetical protein